MSDIDYRIEPKFRNKESDIIKNSVWQLLSSTKLVVVSGVDDGWVIIQYVDSNNGMKRTSSMDIEQFLSFYRLFYKGQRMRDNNRLKRIRQLPCCECGADAPSQAAHSNFNQHGKGFGIKADDKYTIPLCHRCHVFLDQYLKGLTRQQSKEWFEAKLYYVDRVLDEQDNQTDFYAL